MTFSRKREYGLCLLVFAILGLGYFVVWQSYLPAWRTIYQGADWHIFYGPIALAFAAIALSITLTIRRCRETILLPLVVLLGGIGLLFLLRLAGGTYTYLDPKKGLWLFSLYHKQLLSAGIAWAALMALIIFWKDYRDLARYKYLLATTAIVLLLVTTFFGHAPHEIGRAAGESGQVITLNLGFVSFQPHDLVKVLLVLFMAAYLVEKQELLNFARGKYGLLTGKDLRYMGPMVFLWLLMMMFIFKHDDLGAALLLFGSFLGMLYLGTERKIYIIIGLALFIVGASIVFAVKLHTKSLTTQNRIQTRFAIWENPWAKADKEGYQICQALIAIGNGRAVGAGLAGGAPERIPAIQTDMIYAAISEDLGLLGAVAIIAIFLTLISRMCTVALNTKDPFGKLLAAGLGGTLAIQTFVIIGGVTKLIPLTGITLPFISYGGTSFLVNLLLIGIVLKIAETP